jgi:hypothetical protein
VNQPHVTITVTRRQGRDPVDTETEVRTLEELYKACREAAPSEHVRVALRGPEGEVRLGFASFIRQE